MMTARIAGFSRYQSPSSIFVTVTKSAPRNTPVTSGKEKSRSARGEMRAASSLVKLAVLKVMTGQPGMNFSVAGFGVCSVWMNIAGSDGKMMNDRLLAWGAGSPNQPLASARQRFSTDRVELFHGGAARNDRDRNA